MSGDDKLYKLIETAKEYDKNEAERIRQIEIHTRQRNCLRLKVKAQEKIYTTYSMEQFHLLQYQIAIFNFGAFFGREVLEAVEPNWEYVFKEAEKIQNERKHSTIRGNERILAYKDI